MFKNTKKLLYLKFLKIKIYHNSNSIKINLLQIILYKIVYNIFFLFFF
jgi:hypothetical protein